MARPNQVSLSLSLCGVGSERERERERRVVGDFDGEECTEEECQRFTVGPFLFLAIAPSAALRRTPPAPTERENLFFFSILSGSLFFFAFFSFTFSPFFFTESLFLSSLTPSLCVCVCVCVAPFFFLFFFLFDFFFVFFSLSLSPLRLFRLLPLEYQFKKNSGTKKKEPTFVYGAADRSVATKSATFFFLFPFFFKFGWEMTR